MKFIQLHLQQENKEIKTAFLIDLLFRGVIEVAKMDFYFQKLIIDTKIYVRKRDIATVVG